MSNPPISQRPVPEASPGGEPTGAPTADVAESNPRIDALKDRLRAALPWFAYSTFFVTTFLLFVYWTFPYDRLRDKIVAEFDKSQKNPTGARQALSIGRLEPSWFTGVVLKDVQLTSYPADPTKPTSVLSADEIKARVSFWSLFSAAKDITFSAKALGGTIEGSITHTPSAPPKEGEVRPGKDKGPRFDRAFKMEIDGITLNTLAPLKDAVGTEVGGTLKGSIEVVYGETRIDKANGTVNLEIENFWVSDGKKPFKVPALKLVFGSEDITLPQMVIGNVPIQVAVKNGVARVEKMEAKGKDVDMQLDGQITLRENVAESDLMLGLRFKFNETYRKKGDSTAGLLLLLDSEPKLRASKRPDGFYALRVIGVLGGSPQILPAGGGGAAAPGMAMPPGFGIPKAPGGP